MTIDLSNPIVIGVFITIISAAILGIVHYVKTLVQLDFTNKKLSNVLSELDTLHQNYKKEIADINKRSEKEITNTVNDIFSLYDKKIAIILKQNAPIKAHSFELPPQQNNLLVESKPSLPSFPGPKIPDKQQSKTKEELIQEALGYDNLGRRKNGL